ncbi:MAG: radical SAM protein [Pseudomonadales bacterium]|nr:radical SAM protein [Pseudomonadales bacterium]
MYKGRGAVTNKSGRFNDTQVEIEDEFLATRPDTVFFRETAKSIVTRNQSPDIPFDFSINPYRGCEHGCIYCFARPNHAYVDLSPGLDFETRIFYKENSAERLEQLFNKRNYRPSPITLGTATDPYQPVEATRKITRSLLEVMVRYRHPFSLITKSALVLRDQDLLMEAAELGLVKVMVSVTTLDNQLKTRLEPRTASGAARIKAIRCLTEVGVPVGLLMAPLIPWINDHEVEEIIRLSAEAGAESANYILLRLPLEVAPLFQEWLAVHFPDRANRVLNAIRDSRGGKLYDSRFGERMRGQGPFAELFSKRFRSACVRAGIDYAGRRVLVSDQFSLPNKNSQLGLF